MNRYQKMFDSLTKKDRIAFIPFLMLYDPNKEFSLEIAKHLIDLGVDALELGIAFSDPLADGPVIQKACLRAQKSGSSVAGAFELIGQLREYKPELPIGILTYANLVYKNSLARFYGQAQDAGVDSVLVADVPAKEYQPYFENACAKKIDPVLIAAPNCSNENLELIGKYGGGYTYVVTRYGVTGADDELRLSHSNLISKLATLDAPPPVFGFGISKPDHIKQAMEQGARGVICGSRLVNIVEKNSQDKGGMFSELAKIVRPMLDSCSR